MEKSKRYLGCFVSSAGGLFKILDRGEELQVNTVMTHPYPPQRWNATPFKDDIVNLFNERKKTSDIEKVFFHAIYLINLANPDKQKFHLSKLSIQNHLDLAVRIKGNGVIFHTGSYKEITEDQGYEQVVKGINWIFENLPSLDELNTRKDQFRNILMLECSAGSGNVIGDRFEELARIYEGIDSKFRHFVGFCLDTQHMFASGYDIKNNSNDVIKEAIRILGKENIGAVHFNDSKTEFNSKRDRHEDLGLGLIGEDGLKSFLNNKLIVDIPFIMETPSLGTIEGAISEISKLQNWAELKLY